MKKHNLLTILGLVTLFSCSSTSSSNVNNTSSNQESSSIQETTNSNNQTSNTTSVDQETSNSTTSDNTSDKNTSSSNNTSNSTSSNVTSDNNTSSSSSSSQDSSSSTQNPSIETKDVEIVRASGHLESAYIEWYQVSGATSYNVYYKNQNESSYNKIDDPLIRKYPTLYRADIPGLRKGIYDLKVVPVKDNVEFGTPSTARVEVSSHVREGFGFVNGSASGAYNDDGTLKSNAIVLYVSKDNAKTISATIGGEKITGLQSIIDKKEKGDTTPLDIRVLGTLNLDDLDHISSSSEGLQVKGKVGNAMNITIEGIGEDATFKGFGVLIRNCENVEIRNLGIMCHLDDGISIDTNNTHIWIHNIDFFYGKDKGGDQAKGDGSLDTKQSTLITHSFNHFWDSGKCNLQGMKSEETTNSITYHHNWFDHSDSRHPRIRTDQVHIYNNYYDGNSKYGVGATMGASAFVEANYFRHCKYPMLISQQGSDIATDSKGTFSGEAGGMIKAYNNHIELATSFVSQKASSTNFDAYVAESRNETVPSTYKTLLGGNTYNNFDTSSSMYQYTVETPENAKNTVQTYAGRINGGDFKWTFSTSDDTSYAVDSKLRNALNNYTSSLVSVQGLNSSTSGGDTPTPTPDPEPDNPDITDSITHNFTTQGTTSQYFTISGNLATNKGTVNYNNMELTKCLKMESSTSIKFTTSEKMTLTLVFNTSFSKSVKVDNTKYSAVNGILTLELDAKEHTITKGDTANLYFISLSKNN